MDKEAAAGVCLPDGLVGFLTALINIDTTRTARNETAAARCLMQFLEAGGVRCTLFMPPSGQGSIVAEIPGRTREAVLLLCHLDTEIEHAPNGFTPANAVVTRKGITGRGALDCKANAAVFACVMRDLLAESIPPEKTLLLAATAGEEDGGAEGVGWLLSHTDVLSGVTLVLGEGGGYPVPLGNEWLFTLQTGERSGISDGEASVISPQQTDALLTQAVELGYYSDATLRYLRQLPNPPRGRHIPKEHFTVGLNELLQNPISPTKGWTEERHAHAAIFEEALQQADSHYHILPFVTPGDSDNRYFRNRGIETWGFFPLHPANRLGGIHGANEAVTFDSLRLAYRCIAHIVRRLADK